VYKNYFLGFLQIQQSLKFRTKLILLFGLVRTLRFVPEKFLKHLEGTDGLYEMRIKAGSNISEYSASLKKGNLVILLGGFQKKSEKTPPKEIAKAEKQKNGVLL